MDWNRRTFIASDTVPSPMDVGGILARAVSSLRMEGLEPTEAGCMYTGLYLEGRMSADDAIRAIIKSHGLACEEKGGAG